MFSRFINKLLQTKEEKFCRQLSKNIKIGKGFILQLRETSQLQIGSGTDFRNYISIWVGKNSNLKIGKNVFFNNYCSINCLKSIEIGDHTLFGEGVKVYDHNHKYLFENNQLKVSHNEFTFDEVKIGKNCWLGSNVVVLKGVTIGDNSIIGAGCVIHKDVPANSIILNNQDLIVKEI